MKDKKDLKNVKIESSKSKVELGKPSFDVNDEKVKEKFLEEFTKAGKR